MKQDVQSPPPSPLPSPLPFPYSSPCREGEGRSVCILQSGLQQPPTASIPPAYHTGQQFDEWIQAFWKKICTLILMKAFFLLTFKEFLLWNSFYLNFSLRSIFLMFYIHFWLEGFNHSNSILPRVLHHIKHSILPKNISINV